MKPKLMDPNFCYTIDTFHFRVQKTGNGADGEKNDIIFTKFNEWGIAHTWARESSNIHKTINIEFGFNFIF